MSRQTTGHTTGQTPAAPPTPPQKPKKSRFVRGLSHIGTLGGMVQLGFTMVICVCIGFFLGRWLDGLWGSSPACLLIFTFLGAGAALKVLYDYGTQDDAPQDPPPANTNSK